MTTYTTMNIWLVALFATIGAVIGAFILYSIGLLLPVEKIENIIDRWGHVLGLKKEDVKKAESWFDKRGTSTIFFCRFIPIVRSLISIPAGMAKMKKSTFFLYTMLGTAIWNIILTYLGAIAGAGWERIVEYMDTYSYIALVVFAVLGLGVLVWLFKRRRAEN